MSKKDNDIPPPPEAPAPSPSAEKTVPELNAEIERLKLEAEQLRDGRLRVVAEFDNFKKRAYREQLSLIANANEDLVKALIPVLENFERALGHDLDKKGVELIYQQYQDALKKAGLSEYGAAGEEFNPEKHEALMQVESKDHPEHQVVQVLQKGYTLNGKVVQFAKVSVSKGNS